MRVRDKILIAVILALILAIGLIVYLREGGILFPTLRSLFSIAM